MIFTIPQATLYYEIPVFSIGFISILVIASLALFYNVIPGVDEDHYHKLSDEEKEVLESEAARSYGTKGEKKADRFENLSKRERMRIEEEKRARNPEESANIFSRLTFWWIDPLLLLGYQRVLEDADLYNLSKNDSAAVNCTALQTRWETQLTKPK